jgi:Mg2+ and Co2+ transporter CorA
MNKQPDKLLYHLSALAQEHYKLSNDLYLLEVTRQKIEGRGYQGFDKDDILGELGKVQGRLNAMHGKLVSIADTLKTL